MNIVTLSSQNQITLPVSLGLIPRERFFIDKDENKIVLTRIKKTVVDELAGCLEKYIPENKKKIPVEKAIRLAKIAHAKEIATK